jgi:hypothetical protein
VGAGRENREDDDRSRETNTGDDGRNPQATDVFDETDKT